MRKLRSFLEGGPGYRPDFSVSWANAYLFARTRVRGTRASLWGTVSKSRRNNNEVSSYEVLNPSTSPEVKFPLSPAYFCTDQLPETEIQPANIYGRRYAKQFSLRCRRILGIQGVAQGVDDNESTSRVAARLFPTDRLDRLPYRYGDTIRAYAQVPRFFLFFFFRGERSFLGGIKTVCSLSRDPVDIR